MFCSRPVGTFEEADLGVQLYEEERLYAKAKNKVIIIPTAMVQTGRPNSVDEDMEDKRA